MADQRVQRRQVVIGHHREHMVFQVVVHVEIDEPADRVHQHRAGVQPVIGDILGQPQMLQKPRHHMMPRAIEPGQTDQHQRQERSGQDRRQQCRGIDRQPDPRHTSHPGAVRRAGIGRLIRGQPPAGVQDHPTRQFPHVEDAKEVQPDPHQIRRAHRHDLGIAPDNDGIGMVPHMARPPGIGVPHLHEARDMVGDRVHPRGLEGRLVPAFMPARVRGRSVKHTVGQPERRGPPRRPERHGTARKDDHEAQPHHRVPQGNGVGFLHQRADLRGVDLGAEPRGIGQPRLLRLPRCRSGEGIILGHAATLARKPAQRNGM